MIPNGRPEWVGVKNNYYTEAPAFGVMLVIGVDADTSALNVTQPTGTSPARIIVNDAAPIAPISDTNPYGQGTFHGRVIAAYNDILGTPESGDEWGPKVGSWLLSPSGKGFICLDETASGGIANWARVVGTDVTDCCPSTTPYTYANVCLSGSPSGSDRETKYVDCCGDGGFFPSFPPLTPAEIEYIALGTCWGPWESPDNCITTDFFGCSRIIDGAACFIFVPRVMCVDLYDGTGSFTGLDGHTEATYNFAQTNSGWAFGYLAPDNSILIQGTLRPCPGNSPGLYFVGTIKTNIVSDDYPCGCTAVFSACPPEGGAAPSQTIEEVAWTGAGSPKEVLTITTACGTFKIRWIPCAGPPCCATTAPLLITIPDGPNMGVIRADWDGVSGWRFGESIVHDGYVISCSEGIYTLYRNGPTPDSVEADTSACDPIALVFPGAILDATGDVTAGPL